MERGREEKQSYTVHGTTIGQADEIRGWPVIQVDHSRPVVYYRLLSIYKYPKNRERKSLLDPFVALNVARGVRCSIEMQRFRKILSRSVYFDKHALKGPHHKAQPSDCYREDRPRGHQYYPCVFYRYNVLRVTVLREIR